MRRLFIPTAAITAGVVLAACSSGGGSANSANERTPAKAMTVSVKQVGGLGNVLVDVSGKVLYSPDQESDGQVRCDGACTSFWTPVTAGASSTSPMSVVSNLGVIQRPDGTRQLTENGKPLYTFNLDSPGNAKGDNFSDDFGGQHFTWHAVRAARATPTPPATTANGGGSGDTSPSTTSPSGTGGGNGY